jgi:hypothetical protein
MVTNFSILAWIGAQGLLTLVSATLRGLNSLRWLRALVAPGVVLLCASYAAAQGEGPRVFLLQPTGNQVVTFTYLRIWQSFSFAEGFAISGVDAKAHLFLPAYTRFFGIKGRVAQIWLDPSWRILEASVALQPTPGITPTTATARVSGAGDPYVAFRVGLLGAPALTRSEFALHPREFQLYALVGIFLPIGEYNRTRPLSLGSNRWAFRFGVPMVEAFGDPERPVNLEVVPSVYIFMDNTDPFGATRRQQKPLFSVESHIDHNFTSKLWASLDTYYRNGAETTTDGVRDNNRINQLQIGPTVGYQVTKVLGVQVSSGVIVARGEGQGLRIRITFAF